MPRPKKTRITNSAYFPVREKRDQKSEKEGERKENFTREFLLGLTLRGQ